MVYQEYIDPSEKNRLKIGLWYYERKEMIFKILVGFLLFLNLMFWIFVFYSIAKIVLNAKEDIALYNDLSKQRSDVLEIHESQAPDEFMVPDAVAVASSGESLASGVKRADFIVIAENTNEDWIMEVTYSFSWEGGQTGESYAQILPFHSMPLIARGVSVNALPNDLSANIDIKYNRSKNSSQVSRADGALSSLEPLDPKIDVKEKFTDLEVSVRNNGIYSIMSPTFALILRDISGRIIGLGVYYAEKIESQEVIKIQYRWMRVLPANTSIDVHPSFDFLSDSSYFFKQAPGTLF